MFHENLAQIRGHLLLCNFAPLLDEPLKDLLGVCADRLHRSNSSLLNVEVLRSAPEKILVYYDSAQYTFAYKVRYTESAGTYPSRPVLFLLVQHFANARKRAV